MTLFLPALLFTVVLLTDAGTAVSFLFTSDADLFFAEASLGTRKFGLCLEWRVLTFPSGVLGDLDLKLFVGVGLGGGLSFPVWRREDTEGDRDAGFKVQIGDLWRRERQSSPRPSEWRKEDKKIPLASFYKEVERKEMRRRSM
jgi:hypothetical protein